MRRSTTSLAGLALAAALATPAAAENSIERCTEAAEFAVELMAMRQSGQPVHLMIPKVADMPAVKDWPGLEDAGVIWLEAAYAMHSSFDSAEYKDRAAVEFANFIFAECRNWEEGE